MQKRKKKERERKHRRKGERIGTWRCIKGKYIFCMSGVNPKFILGPGTAATRNLGTCCCVHSKSRGGRKRKEKKRKEQKWVKSNPTRGRNQHSKAGIYSGRAFSLSGWKKISLLFGLCDAFCCVSMCKFVYATGELEGVSVIYIGQHSCTSRLLQERWHFYFLISSFIFFSQYQSKTT